MKRLILIPILLFCVTAFGQFDKPTLFNGINTNIRNKTSSQLRLAAMLDSMVASMELIGAGSMVYPGAGIPLSTGSAWGTSITDNSADWNTAFGWGNHSGLYWGVTGNTTLSGAVNIGGGGLRNLSLGTVSSKLNDFTVYADNNAYILSDMDIGLTSVGNIDLSSSGAGASIYTSSPYGIFDLSSTTTLFGTDTLRIDSRGGSMTNIIIGSVGGGNAQVTDGNPLIFRDGKLALRNVANTFSGFFTNTISADRTYTLPNASGTVALTSDIPTLTSSNGITKTGNNFALGGVLTGATTIYGNYNFSFGQFGGYLSQFNVATDALDFRMGDSGGSAGFRFQIGATDATITDGTGTSGGLKYAADYSGHVSITDRSIPDRGWVLSGTATLTNKTLALGSNTISGTKAQFNTAVTDGNIIYEGVNAFNGGFSVTANSGANAITFDTSGPGNSGDILLQVGGTDEITLSGPSVLSTTRITSSSTGANSSAFNMLESGSVSSPINGDFWINGGGFARGGGVTHSFTNNNTGDQSISVTGTTTATIDLSGDATDASITGAGISAISVVGNAITVTSTEVDGSVSNELQTITNSSDATSHTVTLSNSGGTVQFIEGSNITLTTGGTGAAGTVTIASTGGGLSDGDKGDITVGGSGTTLTIDNDAVTYAKIQNVTDARLIGRSAGSSGDAQEITVGAGLTLSGGSLTASASSPKVNDLLAANGTNSIDNGDFAQVWNWNTLQTSGMSFRSNTTAAQNGQNVLYGKLEGANSTSSVTSRTAYFENIHTGTGSSNIAQTLNASGGSINVALEVLGGRIDLSDGVDFTFGNTTGTKFGTSTSSKIGFYNATPVVRQSAVTTAQGIADALTAYGLLPSSTVSGGSGLTYAQSKALSHKFR
jgi:Repeat of unknown function (DUF5907)